MKDSAAKMGYTMLRAERTPHAPDLSQLPRLDSKRSDSTCRTDCSGPIPDDLTHLRQRITKLEDRESKLTLLIDDMEMFSMKRQQPFVAERREVVREKERLALELQKNLKPPPPYPPAPGPAIFQFVDSTWFSTVCNTVVALNLLWMAIANRLTDNQSLLFIMDQLFLIWYVFEVYTKWKYHRIDLFCGSTSIVWWNWLDGGIVFFGVLDQWVFAMLKGLMPFRIPGLSHFMLCLRLFRLLRVLRVVKVFVQGDLSCTEEAPFQIVMSAVITLNSVVMALELDYEWAMWFWFEQLFLVIYTFELAVRMKRLGCKFFINEDCVWNNLDFVMVLAGMLNLWAIPLWSAFQTLLNGESSAPDMGELHNILKIIRMLKILRVLRLVRLLKMVKPFYAILISVIEALDAMKWVMVLALLFLYGSSIVFTSLIGHGYIYSKEVDVPPEAEEYFGSVPHSIFSLFKLMNGDTSVVEPITNDIKGKLLFAAFMVLSNWAVLAILTSVVSDHMIRSHTRLQEEDRKAEDESNLKSRTRLLNQLFSELDTDESGRVSKSEWLAMLQDESMAARFVEVTNLDPKTLIECFKIVSEESDAASSPSRHSYRHNIDTEPSLNCQEFLKYMNNDREPLDTRQILHQRYMIQNFITVKMKELEVSINHILEKARGEGNVSAMPSARSQSSEVSGIDAFFEKERQWKSQAEAKHMQDSHSQFVKELEVRTRVYPHITDSRRESDQARMQGELVRPENTTNIPEKDILYYPPRPYQVPPHFDSQFLSGSPRSPRSTSVKQIMGSFDI